jgi:hypothetical protein
LILSPSALPLPVLSFRTPANKYPWQKQRLVLALSKDICNSKGKKQKKRVLKYPFDVISLLMKIIPDHF